MPCTELISIIEISTDTVAQNTKEAVVEWFTEGEIGLSQMPLLSRQMFHLLR